MAEPTQLTQHIESFVDSSRPPTLQAASLDVIVSLLKSDVLSIGTLVREMDLYLTTTDDIIRARGILLLGEALARLSSKPLDSSSVHSLIKFFTERLADWRALRGALAGCLALMKRKTKGTVSTADAKVVAEAYLQNLQVQSLGQHDRKLCFELIECLLERYPDAVSPLGDDIIYGICEAIDGEKDPECLMVTFHIVEALVQIFSDPSGPLANFASDLFSILGCYFPIHFTHPKAQDVAIQRDDLSTALMHSFSSTPLFEPFVIPLLLEKLSSSLPSAKVDSLKYLSYCALKYGADRMRKYAQSIWSSLKDALYSSGQDLVLLFTLESRGHLDFQKNEMVTEALLLLEKVIIQNNDVFLSLILGDEEINMVFSTISSYNNYEEILSQNKWKLHIVGEILYVSAKASIASCNSIFEHFFPRLMGTLGISVEDASAVCYSNDNGMISKMPGYGSLFLSIEFLGACRDLIDDSDDLKSLHIYAKEISFCMLARFSASLSQIFCSALATSTDRSAPDAHIYLEVKGLQILAIFPGGYSLVSKLTFEDILVTLKSIITIDFNKAFLWKLALEALVHIGSFIHGCNEPEKAVSFMDIVVERVISLVSSNDTSMPFQLKMEVISDMSTTGMKYMLKVVQGLEDILFSNLPEVYAHGDLESTKIVLQLLECYSDKLLPWIQKIEGLEEFLLQFVINMWDQFEKCMAFNVQVHAKELLDATMKVMKIAVACCSVESQRIIVNKSFSVLSSSICLPLKESLFTTPVQLEKFDFGQVTDTFSIRDEWLYSLLASVIIALRPQTHVPNMKDILHLFVIALLKGNVSAAQALGSLVNKLGLKSNGTDVCQDCTIEEAIDIIFSTKFWSSFGDGSQERVDRISNWHELVQSNLSLGSVRSGLLQNHAITGLAWIGKGLLMQGNGKIKDIIMVFLDCLSSNRITDTPPLDQSSRQDNSEQDLHLKKCAADAFQVLMSDSELCLNRNFHAIIRPLYKQRFFSIVMPIIQSLIIKSDPSVSRLMLYRALAHVISDTPLIAILNDAKKIIPLLLDGLNLLSKDVSNKDIIYSILLVLSGILTDKNGEVAVKENAHIIITSLVGLVGYPHMMLVRETAIQCLVAMSELPHPRIYPMRIQVLQAISKALDDPKRVVRQEAVKCRQSWASIASRSLHF